MLDVLKRCYKNEFDDKKKKIKEMIPSYGLKLNEHEEVYNAVNKEVRKYLNVK